MFLLLYSTLYSNTENNVTTQLYPSTHFVGTLPNTTLQQSRDHSDSVIDKWTIDLPRTRTYYGSF